MSFRIQSVRFDVFIVQPSSPCSALQKNSALTPCIRLVLCPEESPAPSPPINAFLKIHAKIYHITAKIIGRRWVSIAINISKFSPGDLSRPLASLFHRAVAWWIVLVGIVES